MRRFGQLIGVKPEAIEEYERLHAQVWPEVLATLYACNVRNYTIFRHEQMLFAYFEYIGEDFAADTAKMAADPKTREWWTHAAVSSHEDEAPAVPADRHAVWACPRPCSRRW
jgi:L-rhamnose mutarotase